MVKVSNVTTIAISGYYFNIVPNSFEFTDEYPEVKTGIVMGEGGKKQIVTHEDHSQAYKIYTFKIKSIEEDRQKFDALKILQKRQPLSVTVYDEDFVYKQAIDAVIFSAREVKWGNSMADIEITIHAL